MFGQNFAGKRFAFSRHALLVARQHVGPARDNMRSVGVVVDGEPEPEIVQLHFSGRALLVAVNVLREHALSPDHGR